MCSGDDDEFSFNPEDSNQQVIQMPDLVILLLRCSLTVRFQVVIPPPTAAHQTIVVVVVVFTKFLTRKIWPTGSYGL